jgi:hypothetical protein
MPSLLAIARYWLDQTDELPDYKQRVIGLGEPCCAGCGWLVPEWDNPVTPKTLAARRGRILEMHGEGLIDETARDRYLAAVSAAEAVLVAEHGPKRIEAAWRQAGRFLDRAHLVDHMFDGSDDASNLIPLCHFCHKDMPAFRVGQHDAALRWIQNFPPASPYWQLATDEVAERNPGWMLSHERCFSGLRRLRLHVFEALAEAHG